MKKTFKLVTSLLLVSVIIISMVSCDALAGLLGDNTGTGGGEHEHVDYVSALKLDMNSTSLKAEVTVKTFIDGDTTHFYVPTAVTGTGVLKARYLAVNTPESTGKIEEWGKKAAQFTKTALQGATSIIIESDDGKWNVDSTGERYLVWVWYKTSDSADYRNLNLELLQNGLAIASNSAQNRYGTTCMSAISQAKTEKLYVHSGTKDPDMYYGDAVELTLKELRSNIESYKGIKVAFNGVVTKDNNNGIYVESYDEETDMYYGIYVYYGYYLSGEGIEIISVGNEVRIVGTLQYYEAGDSYQIADIGYRMMYPDDPSNLQKISEGNAPAYVNTEAKTIVSGTKILTLIETDDDGNETAVTKTFDYGELAIGTSASVSNLTVKSVYTTSNEESSQLGAMTITCQAEDGTEMTVRTVVLYDAEGNLVTAEDYPAGTVISVRGVIDAYNGTYQLKVFSVNDISVVSEAK